MPQLEELSSSSGVSQALSGGVRNLPELQTPLSSFFLDPGIFFVKNLFRPKPLEVSL